jgi:zinc-finger-containing domain
MGSQMLTADCAEAVAYIDRRDAGIVLDEDGVHWRCGVCGATAPSQDLAWCHWRDQHEESADPLVRQARRDAHFAFDPLWMAHKERTGLSREAAQAAVTRWLSVQMGMPQARCLIDQFDVATCERVVTICNRYRRTRG